jgi:CheY-like chemotaxis protein
MEKMLRRLIGEDVHLVQLLAATLFQVRADPNQIEQIILNLSVNARDALTRGGSLTIETFNAVVEEPILQGAQVVKPGQYVCLQVSDSGSGMSAEVQARIFEPFFTTKGPGKGSGLGLSTVYGIVEQSNAHITFSSELGKGTTFRVYLPAVDAPVLLDQTPAPNSELVSGHERILLVEDNELVLKIARRSLEHAGYQVIEATNAADALQRCREEKGAIDLLVTDMVMPGMNGRDLAETILAEYPVIKVLFISGYTGDMLLRVGGVADIALLEKPFTPDSLVRRVREILDAN